MHTEIYAHMHVIFVDRARRPENKHLYFDFSFEQMAQKSAEVCPGELRLPIG